MTPSWRRVTREKPCPICGKGDWCSVSQDGMVAVCMRVEAEKKTRNDGYLHRLRDSDLSQDWKPYVRSFALQTSPVRDWSALTSECQSALTSRRLTWLANNLGLQADSLLQFHPGWSSEHGAYTFPWKNAKGQTTGIHLRLPSGRKFCIQTSRPALFVPEKIPESPDLLAICEGLTDTAAITQIGIPAIGRPSCMGAVQETCGLVRNVTPKSIAIVADNDTPGQRGAAALARWLVLFAPLVKLISPPSGIKDVRQWVASGATLDDLRAVVEAAPVLQLLQREGGTA